MSEPWLETWEVSQGKGLVSIDNPIEQILLGATVDMQHVVLAAAAPDMCRALLAVEWAGTCNSHEVMCYEPHAICPKCGGADPHESFVHPDEAGHHHDCTFDAALTKAGLATQEQRAAARKKLGI